MKGKFRSIGRVAIGLVMVVALTLVVSTTALATITNHDLTPLVTTFTPQDVSGGSADAYTIVIDDSLTPANVEAYTVDIPLLGGNAAFVVSGATVSTGSVQLLNVDVSGNPTQIKVTGGTAETSTLQFTGVSPVADGDYDWAVDVTAATAGTATLTSHVDSIVPTVLSITTQDLDSNGDVETALIVMSEPIVDTTVIFGEFDMELNAGTGFDTGGGVDDDTFSITFAGFAGTEAKDVTYTKGTLTDPMGNFLEDVVTATVDEIDGAAPQLTGIETNDADANGQIDELVVTFSEDLLDTCDYTGLGFTVSLPAYTISGGSEAWSVVTLTLTESGLPDTKITPSLAYNDAVGDITDLWAANALATFTPEVSTDKALPVVRSIITLDRDTDGKVDAAVVLFSEPVDDSTFNEAHWTIGGQVAEALVTLDTADDNKFQLQINIDGNEVPGTDAKDVIFTPGTGDDMAGNSLAAVVSGTIAETDSAAPQLSTIVTNDADANGQIDQLVVTFSEDLLDTCTYTGLGFAVSLPDYTISGGSEAAGVVTLTLTESGAVDSGVTPSLAYDDGLGDITDPSTNALATFVPSISTDTALPVVVSITTQDTDSDGNVETALFVISEPIEDVTVAFGDFDMEGTAGTAFATDVADDDTFSIIFGAGVAVTDAKDVTYTQGLLADIPGNLLANVVTATVAEIDGAAPLLTGIVTNDADANGQIDELVVTFTEDLLDTCDYTGLGFTVSLPDYTISGGSEAAGVVTLTIAESGAGDSGVTPSLAYDDAAGDITDLSAANALATFAATPSTDTALPVVMSIITLDRDTDGKVDAATVFFSEPVDDSTFVFGDWTIGGTLAEALDTLTTVDDDTFQLQITTDANEVVGTDAKDVIFTLGTGDDMVGNSLAAVVSGTIAETDGAGPGAVITPTGTIYIDNPTIQAVFYETVASIDAATLDTVNVLGSLVTEDNITYYLSTSGLDFGVHTFSVTATDAAANSAIMSESFTVATEFPVVLAPGLNLASLPLVPVSTAIADILPEMGVEHVWYYDASTGTWPVYHPANIPASNLFTMEDGKAYWIEMSLPQTMTVTGTDYPTGEEVPPVYAVVAGWNMVGFKSVVGGPADTYFLPSLALTWATSSPVTGYAVDQVNLSPGEGYWVYFVAAGFIVP